MLQNHIVIADGARQQAVDFIQSNWKMLDEEGSLPFNYFYLSENIATMYRDEQRLFTMIEGFSIIILLIACMGLFGLSSFAVEKRKKEIGIRKVLGASVFEVVILFFKRYVYLLLISFAVAVPVSWYLMTDWLQGYARHTNLGVGTFLLAFFAIVVIALGSVSVKTVQAALRNPASVIKEE
ncbi:MAG: ABC transporter permease [Cyclobacteriaceae bacterium]